MRSKRLSLFIILGTFPACTNSSGGGAGAGASWTSEQLGSAKSNCSTTAVKVNSSILTSDAILMCGCIIESASKRWTYDEFMTNEFSYTEALSKEGVFKSCKERVMAQTTGGKWTTSELLAARGNCSVIARDSNPSISFGQAESACSCIFDVAQTRWSYGDFVANEASYTSKLKDEGIIGKCVGAVAGPTDVGVMAKYAGSWIGPCLPRSQSGQSVRSGRFILRIDGNLLKRETRDFSGADCQRLESRTVEAFSIKEDGFAVGVEADKLNLTRKSTMLRYFNGWDAYYAGLGAWYGFSDWESGAEHEINNRSMYPSSSPRFLVDEMIFDIFKIAGTRLYLGKKSYALDASTIAKRPDVLEYGYGFDYMWELNEAPVFRSPSSQTLLLGETVFVEAVDPDGDELQITCDSNCPENVTTVGRYSATWQPTQIGNFNQITLTANDGKKATSKSFDIRVITTPSAPTGLVVTPGTSKISLEWVAPAALGGSQIADYLVQYSVDGGVTWYIYADGFSSDNSAVMSPLIVGVSYVFKVAAINEAGTGPYSSVSSVGVPFTTPSQPTNLVATAGDAQVSLVWSVPTNTGANPVSDYVIEYSSNSGSTWSTFSEGVSSATSAVVTGLPNATAFIFRVAAVNAAGQGLYSVNSSSVTTRTFPSAPVITSGSIQNAQVTIYWSAPSNNGGATISDYRIQYSEDQGVSWVTFGSSISTSTNRAVSGLTNGVSYIFRVAAINAAGAGAYSANSSSYTPRTTPGSPTNLVATRGNSSVSLTWASPASNGGSPITDYRIQYSTNGSTWTTFSDGWSPSTSAVVTDLLNGTAYMFRVAASNGAGTGAYSSNSPYVTPITTPGAPTSLVGNAGNGQVALTWSAPTSNGGSAVSDYIIEFSGNDGTSWSVFTDGISTSASTTVSGLTNGLTYVFRIAAVNPAGAGAYSANSMTLMPKGAPGAPSGVSGTVGNARVDLSWSAPTNNGGYTVTDYIVQRSTDNGVSWTTVSDGASTNTTAAITGLSNGTSYIFRVAAANSAGTGSYSLNSVALMPQTAPSIPYNILGTAGVSLVALTWNAPSNDGGRPILDYIIQYSSNSGINWTTFEDGVSTMTSATITGLINGTGYIFRIYAQNQVGDSNYSANSSTITPRTTVPGVPTNLSATAGYKSVTLVWNEPASDGGSTIIYYHFQYSIDNGAFWNNLDPSVANVTTKTFSGLVNGRSYIYRVAAQNSVGMGSFGSNSAVVIPSSNCVLGISTDDDCYLGSESLEVNSERTGPGGATMTLVYAAGSAGFKIWREKNGSRILNATGIIANGWQKKLTRSGVGFATADFTTGTNIAGRVCPINVFLSFTSMTAANRCLYYDGGNPSQTLGAESASGVEATDWLQNWDRGYTGRGTSSSYYEGNIKTCADKGMRLPVIYETATNPLVDSLPNGDGLFPSPAFATSVNGVPSLAGWTWTASAISYGFIYSRYWLWSATGSAYDFYSGSYGVRCVLP